MSNFESPQSLYLCQTKIGEEDWATLKSAFAKTGLLDVRIGRGGYDVPMSVDDDRSEGETV
jgi:hypothetical protein